MQGRKEGRRREGGRERGRKGERNKGGGGGKKTEARKEGRKHLVPNYWGLIFWRVRSAMNKAP